MSLNLRLTYDPHVALPSVRSISQAALVVAVVHHARQHLRVGKMMILRLIRQAERQTLPETDDRSWQS